MIILHSLCVSVLDQILSQTADRSPNALCTELPAVVFSCVAEVSSRQRLRSASTDRLTVGYRRSVLLQLANGHFRSLVQSTTSALEVNF